MATQISCAFPPGPHVVDHVVEAERLGYERAWFFDSPALYGDIWVIAALAAQPPMSSGKRLLTRQLS